MFYNRDFIQIFFSDAREAVRVKDIKESRFSLDLQNLAQSRQCPYIVVLEQTHGVVGHVVDQLKSQWFEQQGDFLFTQQKNIALVVLTADCGALALYDPKNNVAGVVHAGWKGSYAGIIPVALQTMAQHFGSLMQDVEVAFGPSARACCYEVSESFVQDFMVKYPEVAGNSEVFTCRSGIWYFDNVLFLQHILKKCGILAKNIDITRALCTICNLQFCSFRREKDQANRQVTMITLR